MQAAQYRRRFDYAVFTIQEMSHINANLIGCRVSSREFGYSCGKLDLGMEEHPSFPFVPLLRSTLFVSP